MVLYDSSMGVHTSQSKIKHFLQNCFFGKCFYKNTFWHCYEWEYGIPKIEKKISFLQNTRCTENNCLQKNFRNVCNKGWMGHKRMMSVFEIYFSIKNYGKILWWENFFEGHCCQWEYRGPTIEKKIYTLEKTFFSLNFVFLEIIWFVWYHSAMGVSTINDTNKKNLRKKFK